MTPFGDFNLLKCTLRDGRQKQPKIELRDLENLYIGYLILNKSPSGDSALSKGTLEG